jgi:hypothetical protein
VARADEHERAARVHLAQQVRRSAIIERALDELWDRTVDPSDLRGSFQRFREKALPLIQAGRLTGASEAQKYYAETLVRAGYDEDPLRLPAPVQNVNQTKASLAAGARIDYASWRLAVGDDPSAILAAAKLGMLGAAKRQILSGGRTHLIRLSERDPNVRGWARVSDGAPCAFCAMLVSRGPVYSAGTVGFRAHDRCGCSVRVVPMNDPTKGWGLDARAYGDLWGDNNDLVAFRAALRKQRADPASTLSQTLAGNGYGLAA